MGLFECYGHCLVKHPHFFNAKVLSNSTVFWKNLIGDAMLKYSMQHRELGQPRQVTHITECSLKPCLIPQVWSVNNWRDVSYRNTTCLVSNGISFCAYNQSYALLGKANLLQSDVIRNAFPYTFIVTRGDSMQHLITSTQYLIVFDGQMAYKYIIEFLNMRLVFKNSIGHLNTVHIISFRWYLLVIAVYNCNIQSAFI